ncbi:protein ZGRF1 isoform X3 [Cuculus canorus]|uniref:protein ZGRF1 isoform X3 n=1 Tax=Cuculus canorus TaxID=55661 RepID=UPI0023AA583D|nr:protein ZGRF1 isoform X3 [Cuculus canorus]
MASQEFIVLYTHQKLKKSKTWQDGILRISTGRNKAVLFDDKGQCLESIFIKSEVNAGDNLESERYLITVEEVKANEKSFEDQPRKAETPAEDRNGVKRGVLPLRHLSVGLKRKFTGFQVPRQVEKKISMVEDGENLPILPLSKQCQGTFPSKFYITSPLFSTVGKKDAETNPSADFHQDACMGNIREHMSLSSLLSGTFLDRCDEAEKQNSHQSLVEPVSPLIPGHAQFNSQTVGHGAVSHNIRSTAQIIALLKSKPAQERREQTTAEVTECHSGYQASENTGSLYDQKSTILPAFSGNPAERLIQNIPHPPFTKGTVNDKKEWNAEVLLNSAEQPCEKEVTGQRRDKKACNLSQDLQDRSNANSFSLPEFTISRMSNSKFVPSSGGVLCSASPVTLEKNLSRYREHSVTSGLEENPPAELQSELQPSKTSEGMPGELEHSGAVALTETGVVEEELRTDLSKDSSPDEQVMEVNFNLMEAFDFNDTDNEDVCERDVKKLTEGNMLSQSPDCFKGKDVAQSSALRCHSPCEVVTCCENKEVRCSAFDGENDGNHCTESIPSQLCDNTVGSMGRIAEDSVNLTRSKAGLLSDEHNVNEVNESQLSIEATNREKVLDGCAAHTINGTAWIKNNLSDLLCSDTDVNECDTDVNECDPMFEKTESISCIPTSRILSAVDKKTEDDVIEVGCLQSPGADLEHFWGTMSDGIKPSSPLLALSGKSAPSYGSFQYFTDDHRKVFGISHEEDTLIPRSSIYPFRKGRSSPEETAIGENELESIESINTFRETCKGERIVMDYLKHTAMAQSSSGLPDLKTEARTLPVPVAQIDPGTYDCQPKSPASRSLHEDDINFIREEKLQTQPDFNKESRIDQSPLALNVCSEVPPWPMSGSPSHSDLRQRQWTSWDPGKMISSLELPSSLDPDSAISPASEREETIGDIRELLVPRILPREPEVSEIFLTQEKPSYSEKCSLSTFKPTVKTRTPLVTFPGAEMSSEGVYATGSEEVQQSFSSSVVSLCNKSAEFPINAFCPEDRNYETSVFGEYAEDRQRESVQPVFPNVTSENRQSKWLKYQNSDLRTQNSDDEEVIDDICAENVLGMLLGDTGESSAVNKSAPGSASLLTAKSARGKRCMNTSSQDLISERKLLSLHLSQTPLAEATQKVLSHLSCHTVTGDSQEITISELSFPNVDEVKHANLPKRKVSIPTVFQSYVHYKQTFKAALTEQLNIMLFELSQRLHNALSKVDISFYTALKDGQSETKTSCVPLCNHMHPAKLVMVKKEGQNKGRLFYTCDAPKAEQCSFFKWIEDVNHTQIKSRPSVVLHDIKSIGTYLRSQMISLYEGCQLLVRKPFEIQTQRCSKFKKFMNTPAKFDGDSKTKLYLKLSRKEHYSLYSKDDIWVVSKTLNFEPLDTFIASSAFFGPSSNNEVELLPLKGYCPSNWRSDAIVHALLVCNASGELTSLRNMEEHFNPSTLPLIPFLLKMNFDSENVTSRVNRRKFNPPAISLKPTMMHGPVSTEVAMGLAEKMIQTFSLNPDQAASLIQIAQMMTSSGNTKPAEEHQTFPITIIRGVFGAGKSYLLSVVILFLVQLFESSEATEGPRPVPWKLLIASSTNVAVDRILLGLLDLGFEDFIRVGSIRKIAKAILPHSLHTGTGNENEQLKELLALMKEDLTPVEKIYVRKSIEQHKLGTNKTILQQVKVVGATCAACPFPCLNALKFPVVMLDECSQMTEPASLLPIARFQCEKLVLVGDPKQLPPTIQGSESIHEKGLEQTLFDRLCLMGHKPILLRTQYRCHPAISAIANELFYEGNLIDGVSEKERSPLLEWLPTLCFYSVNGMEQIERDNSFYNMAEVHFTVKLIQSLVASGIEGSMIGVITLYKSQMYKIQNLLGSVHSEAFKIKAVQVSTVDAFQGAEKEIVVLSCVRTRQMGFIDSEKRMNVALTRAKRHLLIVGNLACLSRNRLWGGVIQHCKGWENGLQHVSQCEQQLNDILKCYLEKWKEEEQNKKKEK